MCSYDHNYKCDNKAFAYAQLPKHQQKRSEKIEKKWKTFRETEFRLEQSSAVGERWPTAKQLKWSTEWTAAAAATGRLTPTTWPYVEHKCTKKKRNSSTRTQTTFQSSATFLACHSSLQSFRLLSGSGFAYVNMRKGIVLPLSVSPTPTPTSTHTFALSFCSCVCVGLISSCQADVNSID